MEIFAYPRPSGIYSREREKKITFEVESIWETLQYIIVQGEEMSFRKIFRSEIRIPAGRKRIAFSQ